MSIGYTSLLALVQPVDGTEVGTWGDDVNNGVSSILDVAVAGTQNITTDANVTLTITQATSSGTNLSSTSAQYAILLLSGARTATRTVTLPASSKTYTVMNSTTGGYAQTVGGLTIAVGEYCTIAYNTSSSTWVKTSTQSGSGVFTTVTATVAYQGDFSNSTLLSRTLFTTTTANSTTGIYAVPSGTATAASWQATNAADPTNASKILIATNGSTDVQLVSGRNGTGTYLPLSFYTNGSQQAQLTVAGVWTTVNDASIHGLTVGLGAGSVYSNMAFGANALSSNTTGNQNTALGGFNGYVYALGANTSGSSNTAVGSGVLGQNTTGSNNTALGQGVMNGNTTGGSNTAIGGQALYSNTTASNNTAVGYQAGYSNTSGIYNTYLGGLSGYTNSTASGSVFIGYRTGYNNANNWNTGVGAGYPSIYLAALESNTTGTNNTAMGVASLGTNTTGSQNTAIGLQALQANTTASYNTAVGYQAGYSNTTGSSNVAMGIQALQANTTASNNTAVGYQAGYSNTTGGTITFVGYQAGYGNTTGTDNCAFGRNASQLNSTGAANCSFGNYSLYNNTGSNNSAYGYQSLNANTSGANNSALGYQAGYSQTSATYNTFIGSTAGYSVTTGNSNTFIGAQSAGGVGAGYSMTTGSKNTIIGGYTGNQGGLDIRTASNFIVLSDGDGNPRGVFDGSGNFLVGTTNTAPGSGNTATGCVLNGSLGLGYFSRSTDASFIMNTNADGPISRIYRSGTQVGSISVTTTTTAYNTSSDQRLKENIQDADSASSLIDSLQVRKFDWKSDGSHQRYGFVAQELVTVAPEAVFQPTDTEEMMSVDYSKLVPMMLKEIQSLRARLKAANIA